jgi:predicted helicase
MRGRVVNDDGAEGGNVFLDQIRTGVGITLLVRRRTNGSLDQDGRIYNHAQADFMKSPLKLAELVGKASVKGVQWQTLRPSAKYHCLTEGMQDEYENFVPLGTNDAKSSINLNTPSVFNLYGGGVKTNRDE